MTLSREIARFVVALSPDTIPAEVTERARTCVLNGYGIALGALGSPYYRVAAAAALDGDGEWNRGATVLGDGRRTTVSGAALANGALFHGRCQEDTCGTVHAGAILVPLLAAMVETGYPMDNFLPALVAGYEVAGLFDRPYGPITSPAGLRASILYGTLGAAAAAGRMMALDKDRMAAALSNAAGFTGGTLQCFSDGSDEWRYQVGIAAQTGLWAARLARAGSVSAPRALEGEAGFVRAFVRRECDVQSLLERLGADWAISRVTFKPYPVCAYNQTPIDICLNIRERLDGRAIAGVAMRMSPIETRYPGILAGNPLSTISGTVMSTPFCVAATLLYGVPDMARLTTYDDVRVSQLVDRIEITTDATVGNLSPVIEVTAEDGEVITGTLTRTVMDYAYDRDTVARLVRRVAREEAIPDKVVNLLEDFADRFPAVEIGTIAEIFTAARQAVCGPSGVALSEVRTSKSS